MANKKKKKVKKFKFRLLLSLIVFGSITIALGYNLLCNVKQINELKSEKKDLQNKIVSLKEEKDVLETDILKLKDSDYIAKYVREKYFYSKDGEVILRMPD